MNLHHSSTAGPIRHAKKHEVNSLFFPAGGTRPT